MTQNTTAKLSGIININKPPGITSHDVVIRIRRLLAAYYLLPATKVGHTGTLDPFASGVLLIAIGPATRLIQFTHDWDKEYETVFTLGATSDTDDVTGKLSKPPAVAKAMAGRQITNVKSISKSQPSPRLWPAGKIQKTLNQFIGTIQQIPPDYSAIKIQGKKSYELARVGESVSIKPRSVTIHDIKIISYKYPDLKLTIRCGTGTYIRAIARDLGRLLKTGAYVSYLCRTRIGTFDISTSLNFNKLSTGTLQNTIKSPSTMISHLPSLILNDDNVAQLQKGQAVEQATDPTPNTPLSIFDQNQNLIGIARFNPSTSLLLPKIILPPIK
ncbi:MAG: tRNA pseudouridine(55) synthase TruB [Candidatus Andersenbacteria bacterium]|nr:tRNA pseudouridine(55) synthase TruB [bacterium]MDZ4225502.1 tRNA pseudouridine(55) synthase TruB [Candidatus Andersenbacteria bacterium]